MRNRRSIALRRCLSQAFGPNSSLVAFDALATPVPTACGDLLFFNSKKKEAKNAALMRRGACTAQIAFGIGRHALACEESCKMAVGCETALRAVRDGFIRMVFWDGIFAMASLNDCVTSRESFSGGHGGTAPTFLSSRLPCVLAQKFFDFAPLRMTKPYLTKPIQAIQRKKIRAPIANVKVAPRGSCARIVQ